MADIGKAYVQIVPTAKGISGQIEKEMGGVGKSAGTSFSGGFGSVIGGVGKVAIAAVGAAATAVGGIVTSATKNFADYEQLVGGVETLFGDSANYVINRASAAFETAGLSANDYMETVTSFSASLLQSLGGDTEKAAKVADQAIVDMSDNANKMGSSMESIQNAYQGFAKQNYTMLDNLKLGYGGTKEEMKRLLEDAQKISGQKFDLSSYSDIIEAIHVIQTEMGITGTTSKEAASTISGSLSMMGSAWQNVVTQMASGEMDRFDESIWDLVYSVETFANNIMPVVQQALSGVTTLISDLAPEISAAIPGLVAQVLPGLLDAAVQILQTLAEGILQAVPQLMPTLNSVILQLIQVIVQLLPQLLTVGAQIIAELASGIGQALPTLIPEIAAIVPDIVQALIDNAPLLIQAAIELINGLVQGLMEGLPVLIEALPTIVQSLVDTLVANLPLLIDACVQLVNGIVAALPTIIQAILTALPTIIDSVTQGLITCTPQLVDGCIQLANGIIAALPQIMAALIAAMPQIMSSMAQALATGFPLFLSEITRLITSIWTQVFTFGAQLLAQVGSNLSQLLAVAVQWLGQLPNKAAYFAGRMIGEFINLLRTLPSKIQQILTQALNAVKSWGQKLVAEGPKMAKEFIEKLVNGFKGIGEKLVSVGKDIVSGLQKGIKDSWKNLTDWVKSLAGDLIKGLKDSLKIKSPSRVMADEIGQWIPAGIAQGIQNGMHFIDDAVNGMSSDLTLTATSAISSDMAAAKVTAAQGGANGDLYALLSTYLPVIANKEVNIKLEGGMDRFFRAMQAEARRNYQLTGATI